MIMSKTIIVTGASSGCRALSPRSLADARRTVHAGIRDGARRNAPRVADAKHSAAQHDVDLRTVELDVTSQESVDAAVERHRRGGVRRQPVGGEAQMNGAAQ